MSTFYKKCCIVVAFHNSQIFKHVELVFSCFLIYLALSFSSMAPNAHFLAALHYKATKHGEMDPEKAALLAIDSSFIIKCSYINLLGNLQSGLRISEMSNSFNASSQHFIFTVTPTVYLHNTSISSPISLTTENMLANSNNYNYLLIQLKVMM